MSTSSISGVVKRQWVLLLLCIGVAAVLAVIVTAVQPKTYRAEAKLLVRNSRMAIVMGTDTPSQAMAPSQVTEEDVNSEIEVLRSREILTQVAEDAGMTAAGTKPSPKAAEQSVLKMYKNLDIAAIRKTNVIQMAFYAHTPQDAVKTLRFLTSRYVTASISAHAAPNSYEFFEGQVDGAKKNMAQAQQAVSEFRARSGISSAEQQRTELIKELAATQDQIHDADVKLQELGSRRRALEGQSKNVTSRLPTQVRTAVNQPLIEHLQANLNALENTQISLLQQYKPTDRLVQINSEKIANTKAELAESQHMAATEQTTDINPLFQYVTKEAASNDVDSSGYLARLHSLKNVEGDIQKRLAALDKDSVTLANLERVQEDAQDNYAAFLKRMEQARVSTQMDRQNIANVAVIEEPMSSPIPVSPSLRVNLLVGLGAGALVGFALAWFKDSSANARLKKTHLREFAITA
ncbi:GumC family protein [Terriglobus roseus]|nr:Wzz/FepE/Etk N-terminal domain-containing protein [Terriglobus roseus]